MPNKYYFDAANLETGEVHRVLFDDALYDNPGVIMELTPGPSPVVYDLPRVTDKMEPLVGSSHKLSIVADTSLTYDDLYPEDDKQIKVVHMVGTDVVWAGWLTGDGISESFVTDSWIVDFTAIDGLSMLESIAFAEDDGTVYTGVWKLKDILITCLSKIGLDLDVLLRVDLAYQGQTGPEEIYLSVERYQQEDSSGKPMAVKDVMSSLMAIYGLQCRQYRGAWVIYPVPELALTGTIGAFRRYDHEGNYLGNESIDFTQVLGSHINGRYPHHAGADQFITGERANRLQVLRYVYGFSKNLALNGKFQRSNGDTPGWTALTAETEFLTPRGVRMGRNDNAPKGLRSGEIAGTAWSDPVGIKIGFFRSPGIITQPAYSLLFLDGAITWSWGVDGQWHPDADPWVLDTQNAVPATPPTDIPQADGLPYFTNTITGLTPPPNTTGSFVVEFENPTNVGGGANVYFILDSVELFVTQDQSSYIKGEIHTVTQLGSNLSYVPPEKQVFNGDGEYRYYVGTVFSENTGTIPTAGWAYGLDPFKTLLRVTAERLLKMYSKRTVVFSGSVYGIIPYICRVAIDGVPGVFQPYALNVDYINNICSCEFKEIMNPEIDLEYDMQLDYGTVIKPTVNG